MLKSFGIAAAIGLAALTAGQSARPAPIDRDAGFGRHEGMERPRPVPREPGRDHRRMDRRDRDFARRAAFFWGWPYAWGPGYEAPDDAYLAAGPAPYPPLAAKPVAPPPCPLLLHWDPKLGRATRESLCD